MENTLSRIGAMLSQQDTCYLRQDWLSSFDQEEKESLKIQQQSNKKSLHLAVDSDCRVKMAIWFVHIIKYFKFHCETAEIAMNILDRFMASPCAVEMRGDRNLYQLASMGALYTAIKVHECTALDPKLISNLSHGVFSPKEIEAIEMKIILALKWRLNPPTATSFVREFMSLIPDSVLKKDVRETAYELTQLQTDLAFRSSEFIAVQPSVVAYSALMNSLESLGIDETFLGQIGYVLSEAIQIDCNAEEVIQIQTILYESVVDEPVDQSLAQLCRKFSRVPQKEAHGGISISVSPRTVSTAY